MTDRPELKAWARNVVTSLQVPHREFAQVPTLFREATAEVVDGLLTRLEAAEAALEAARHYLHTNEGYKEAIKTLAAYDKVKAMEAGDG